MEVHANSNYRMFVDTVLPNATALRARYAACKCTFALSVLVRCARTPPPGARSSRRWLQLPCRRRGFRR